MNGEAKIKGSVLYSFAFGFLAVLVFCVLGMVLSAIGLPSGGLVGLFLTCVIAIAVFRSRTSETDTPATLGSVAGIERLSAFGLFGIVGGVFAYGHDGLSILVGLTAGFVISLVLIAPRLSVIKARSMPDFLSLRFRSEGLRYITLAVIAVTVILFVAAQLVAVRWIAQQGLGVAPIFGVLLGAVGILALTLPLGGRARSGAPLVLAMLAAGGIILSALVLVMGKTGVFVPHLGYGGLFADISAAEARLGRGVEAKETDRMLGLWGSLLLALSLAAGAAVMPHSNAAILVRGSRAGTQQALRTGLIVFVIIASALPAFGILARAEIAVMFTQAQGTVALEALPIEMRGAVSGCRAGVLEMTHECEVGSAALDFRLETLDLMPAASLLALPGLSGASVWVLAMLAMVGFSVAIIGGSAAVGAAAVSMNSRATVTSVENASRTAIIALTMLAAVVALFPEADLIGLGFAAFTLAGASLFAPLVLSLWWSGTSAAGAIAGMLGGFLTTGLSLVGSSWGFDGGSGAGDAWFGTSSIIAGALGIFVSHALTIIVSLLTEKPRQDAVAMMTGSDVPDPIEDPEVLE